MGRGSSGGGGLTGLCSRPATYSVSQLSKSRLSLSVEITPYLTSYTISLVPHIPDPMVDIPDPVF